MAFALGVAILLTAALLRLQGPLNAGLLRIRLDFRPSPPLSLIDSLPALSPGLTGLEAFSLSLPAGTLSTPDRSLWLANKVDTVKFAFHSERERFDSATLYLWAGDSVRQATIRRRGSHDWNIPIGLPVSGWSEIAGLYLSHPPLFRIRAGDTSIALFERLEGGLLHVIADAYALRAESPEPPDTAYPARDFGEILLLARGKTLAVANPSGRLLRLRLLSVEGGSHSIHHVPARTVHVYRGLLNRGGPTLAYTGPGEPLCVLGRCRAANVEFFRLAR